MVNISVIRNEWLESFKAQKIWYERIADRSRKGEMSAAMRQTYNSNMRQFIMFWNAGGDVEANPDSILEWAKSVEGRDIVTMLKKFSLWLQGKVIEGYEQRSLPNRGKYLNLKSAEAKAHGSIRGFFRHNQIWLPRRGTRLRGTCAKTRVK
jgi:hypothetical protein